MKRDVAALTCGLRFGLGGLSVVMSILVHCGFIDPTVANSLQEKADLARQVLTPIEYCLKQRDKNRRK